MEHHRTPHHSGPSAVLHHPAPPVLTGLIVTDEPNGRRTIQDGAFYIVFDAQDRVRRQYYLWSGDAVCPVPRVPACRRGATPTAAQQAQAASDAYWCRVSRAWPRPSRAAASPVAAQA